MGQLVSELLADALGRKDSPPHPAAFYWLTTPGTLLIDPADREAVFDLYDREAGRQE